MLIDQRVCGGHARLGVQGLQRHGDERRRVAGERTGLYAVGDDAADGGDEPVLAQGRVGRRPVVARDGVVAAHEEGEALDDQRAEQGDQHQHDQHLQHRQAALGVASWHQNMGRSGGGPRTFS